MSTITANEKLARRDRAFIGHPVGLGWLSSAEFWERFSYYGMTSVLVLFLAHYLLQPGNIVNVVGFDSLRDLVVFVRGPTNDADLAVAITGLYSTVVYLTPLVGGFIADRVIGRTWAVAMGAVFMSAGLFMMMVDSLFVPALAIQVLGVGFFKGNIAAQVGDLYSHDDPRRADGFMIYFLGIQMSAIGAPIVCGWLFEDYDPHWGFLAAGIGMVIGLAIYLFGKYSYPPEPFHKKRLEAAQATPRRRLSGRDWATIVLLLAMLPVLALSILGNQEIFNAYLLWSEKTFELNLDLYLFSVELPVSTLISVDAGISLVLMTGVIAFWRWYGKRWKEPVELTKIIIGTALGALAPLALMAAAALAESTGEKVSIAWAVLFHVINDLGFSMVLPVGLALYSRLAPSGLGGIMIAIYYLHIAGSNFLVGMLGAPKDAGVSFWLMIAALIGGSAVALLIFRVAFASLLAPAFEKGPSGRG